MLTTLLESTYGDGDGDIHILYQVANRSYIASPLS